jgi:hypothetical protein
MNLVTLKAVAKHEHLLNKPSPGALTVTNFITRIGADVQQTGPRQASHSMEVLVQGIAKYG